jgi:HD superfamily phosphohydrolase
MSNKLQIRDSLHGVIYISEAERSLIESQVFVRLRTIKQLGFADFAFPGATHTRFAHSLGAMHVASQIFDRIFDENSLSSHDLARFRQIVRLAALLHDVGHPPLSHTTEMIMPVLACGRRATHEDFTLKIIRSSEISELIKNNCNFNPEHIACLIEKNFTSDYFIINNINYAPVLSQIISSEIDCDRMDYLLRDSLYCGVNYGKFDYNWLLENLIKVERDNYIYLGLRARAIFAFEDFLLSRYHMFVSVYLHHTPVIMEKMLERFFYECPHDFTLPACLDAYLALDDSDLWHVVRHSSNSWAQRIVKQRPYAMLSEYCDSEYSLDEHVNKLHKKGINTIVSCSRSILAPEPIKKSAPLWVRSDQGKIILLEEYTKIFTRYQNPVELLRIFVDKTDLQEAQRVING